MIENYRSRTHLLVLYPDCSEHLDALEIIKHSYDYACILHDKDSDENGEQKKPHYHVVIRTKNQTWASALADELGITSNYLEKPRSLDNALAYLIHYHDSDKYQYSIDDVAGNMVTRLSEYLSSQNKSEGEIICELLNTIKDWEGHINVTDFAYWCASNGYWAEYRRAGAIINECIKEHNYGKWCELTSPNF